ncbi:helix-hairpin-helix domain-containing protein [Candidatus Bipolaricaulota bacterium]|nr:helix-hairpin-helix domain-containing protein [Candidatus Bipolaricaulota bacterium]
MLVGGAILVADELAVNADLARARSDPDSDRHLVITLDAHVLTPEFLDGPACVDLNQATEQQLIRLSGIGEVLAARIVAYREEHGPFETVDDLERVSGIGPVLIEAIREDVTVVVPSTSVSAGDSGG